MKILISFILMVAFASAESIIVTEHTPITRAYTEKVKVGQQCYEDTVEVNVRCGGHDTNSIGLDTIIGATLGVIVGNQIGKGNGRIAAKIGGGFLGAGLANNNRGGTCKSYETITRCNPQYDYQTTKRVIGWNNCAIYKGEKVCKQTANKVGSLNVVQTISVY